MARQSWNANLLIFLRLQGVERLGDKIFVTQDIALLTCTVTNQLPYSCLTSVLQHRNSVFLENLSMLNFHTNTSNYEILGYFKRRRKKQHN